MNWSSHCGNLYGVSQQTKNRSTRWPDILFLCTYLMLNGATREVEAGAVIEKLFASGQKESMAMSCGYCKRTARAKT